MRAGLVVVGVAFLALAVGTAASVYAVPPAATDRQVSTEVPPGSLSPNETRAVLLYGLSSSAASLSVHWASSGPVSAMLYDTPGCTVASTNCATGHPIATWLRNSSGSFERNGETAYPYLLVLTNHGPSSVSVQASCLSRTSTSAPVPVLTTLLFGLTIGALAVIGGIGLLLGLFLRAGFRSGPAPLVSRHADDAAWVAGVGDPQGLTGPRTGSTPSEAEAPRPGPPSPGR